MNHLNESGKLGRPARRPAARHAGHSHDAHDGPQTIVVLRPFGRGNWATVELRLGGRRAPPPLYFRVGEAVELAGERFRVAKILSA